MVTSRREPFFLNAEISAVTITAATFLDDSVAGGTFIPNLWRKFATV